ncbi:MAG: hypothetical protein GEV09_11025 [Pseudonocardiaceae bacterium]|nr:hypothetical protein [Pseudonocardiaceae bacterium]
MGADLILSMIVAAVVTRGWEQSKRRSAAAWAETQQRTQQRRATRDKTRQARTATCASRLRAARATGPRDPLWWAYAVGWVTAGAVRGGFAAIQGAREGAAAGAREGSRLGREGARRDWSYRQTWDEYRRRHRASAGGDEADPVGTETVLEPRPACGVYTTANRMIDEPQGGRVCPACVGWQAATRDPQTPAGDGAADDPSLDYADLDRDATAWGVATVADDGTLRVTAHRDRDAAERAAEQTPRVSVLGANGRPTATVPEVYYHPQRGWTLAGIGVPSPERASPANSAVDPADSIECPNPRCVRDLEAGNRGCADCIAQLRERGTSGTDEQLEAVLIDRYDAHEASLGDDTPKPYRPCGGSGDKPQFTTGGTAMNALPAGQQVAGTGEGYTDTVATLTTLSRQLAAAHETAQTLIDNLTAAEVDNDTITNVGELVDMLDTSSPLAERTARHVQQRHEPVAEAVAGAGGSGNVAAKSWYDDH